MTKWLKSLIEDPLFIRMSVFLFATPLTLVSLAAICISTGSNPPQGWEWLLMPLLLLCSGYGLYLVYVSCFGSKEQFESASAYLDGGSLEGLVFFIVVGIIAIPLTIVIRWVFPR